MIIRRATESDLAGIVKVYHAIFTGHPDLSPSYEDAIRNHTVLVADENGDVIGFGVFRATIDSLYILPGHRSRRIGSRLLEQLENIARRQGVQTLYIYARSPEPG